MKPREYQYVGPSDVAVAAKSQPSGARIASVDELGHWLATTSTESKRHPCWIVTFIISIDGCLYIAPRRSEHVACAGGGPVLSAGEIMIDEKMTITEISNQSTGFCPEPESWPAVSAALDRAGIKRPNGFTTEVIFRRCTECGECNIVKDSWYYCGICDAKLSPTWNFVSNTDEAGDS